MHHCQPTSTDGLSQTELQANATAADARARLTEQGLWQGQRAQALGGVAGGMAHDFNNLLGVVSNSAHLIARHPAAAELQMPLAALFRSVDRGSRLIQHLVRLTQVRTAPAESQALALADALADAGELMHSVLGSRFDIRLQVAADTASVHADPSELELALVNLALNARDAMPGGGELRLTARNASAEDLADIGGPPTALGQAWVLILLDDSGPGMAPEIAERVFEPFFTTKQEEQRSGLGLSQVQRFCVQAGGAAFVASTPGVGATVSMVLPALRG